MPGKKEFDVKFWVTDNLIAYSLLSKSSDSVIYVINAIRKSFDWTELIKIQWRFKQKLVPSYLERSTVWNWLRTLTAIQ